MKHAKSLRTLGLSAAIGLGMILTACGAPSAVTPTTAPAAVVQPTIGSSPTTLPAKPTATLAALTATTEPTDTTIGPTPGAAAVPSCQSPATLTPAQTEGPYYKPNSPERTSLIEPGMGGTQLIVTGYVFTLDCKPIAKAWLDFWQADDKGAYDNAGYRLRGHLFTDETGRYTLETIVPGEYPGRTEHIHVKVQPPNGSILTTQLYFPGVAANERDSIFDPALLADVQGTADGEVATFDFVVNAP
ncbi:MAG TPA: dioxygenase [Anaerolineae bacterium]|nr:dioxygenase [Anaerolineae bacterium]